ncbi:dynein light chain roadblock-type 1 [Nannochloropsis gaditana]|uniref:Dynein light chain roadblock-type 1 n=1 Tax=Nannochloropsis gaditana TaxID=72520 RepID=W7UAA5_9STRA|nr:dynein light chain roadblock-type 1 [Nannochloropsis gaditana]EWM29900.1 dynein light chain roadblock-type 1 [Nannochloropsis gaditana]EWM29901.1 dynein light chain roadblock-type 1 [Nannochloropsis gaditana]
MVSLFRFIFEYYKHNYVKFPFWKSQVEDILERIKTKPSVEGYLIANQTGQVLRRSPKMNEDEAHGMATTMRPLVLKAENVVRDLDPQNELQFLRIKTKNREIISTISTLKTVFFILGLRSYYAHTNLIYCRRRLSGDRPTAVEPVYRLTA